MWKYILALVNHRPKLYRGTTDRFCRNLTPEAAIRIWDLPGVYLIAFSLLDLTNVQNRRSDNVGG